MKLRLGTRGSELALTQSGTVAERLRAAGHEVDLAVIRTAGDRSQAPSFGTIGAQGVFVRDIEKALLDGSIELAVHSFKDLPTASPAELTVAAVPPRVDPADVLIVDLAAHDEALGEGLALARGARVGTSSVRRGAWLAHFRPDIVVAPLRGNVPTRIRKLREGEYDAVVLAAAGISRLGADGGRLGEALRGLATIRLDPFRFVPAPAQGALAVQCRAADAAVRDALAALDDPESRAAVTIEREALRRAEGGCNTAFGAYCAAGDGEYRVAAMLERDGRIVTADVAAADAETAVEELWRTLEESR